jgi:hypothetical protein
MIILQFERGEKESFEKFFKGNVDDINFLETKKLGGDEILLQSILTVVSVASPFIIQFFLDQHKKNKEIKIIRKGVEMTFKSESDLKKYLKKFSAEDDK